MEISSNYGIKLVDMFPLETIGSIKWNAEYGQKLKSLRGKTSRRVILERLNEEGVSITQEMMRLIEDGSVKTVSPEIFVGLCNVYQIHFSQVIPCVRIGIPSGL